MAELTHTTDESTPAPMQTNQFMCGPHMGCGQKFQSTMLVTSCPSCGGTNTELLRTAPDYK